MYLYLTFPFFVKKAKYILLGHSI